MTPKSLSLVATAEEMNAGKTVPCPDAVPLRMLYIPPRFNFNSTGPEDGSKVYLGASEPSFKRRHSNHNTSFKHSSHRKDTSLSAYVWDCKESGKNNFQFQWSVVKQTHGYNRVSKTCDLCLNEKLEILNFKDRDKLLNKRSELISKCRHFNKYLLKNMK